MKKWIPNSYLECTKTQTSSSFGRFHTFLGTSLWCSRGRTQSCSVRDPYGRSFQLISVATDCQLLHIQHRVAYFSHVRFPRYSALSCDRLSIGSYLASCRVLFPRTFPTILFFNYITCELYVTAYVGHEKRSCTQILFRPQIWTFSKKGA